MNNYYHRDVGEVGGRLSIHRYNMIIRNARAALGNRALMKEDLANFANTAPSLPEMMAPWYKRMDRWLGETSKYVSGLQGKRERQRRRYQIGIRTEYDQ